MGIFDIFINKDDETTSTTKKNSEKQSGKNDTKKVETTTVVEKPMTDFSTVPITGSEQPEIIQYFEKVFTQSNFAGPDYYEFVMAIKNSSGLAVDDKTKFIITYNSLKAQGADKAKLIDTANKYLDIFSQKFEGFKTELQGVFDKEITSRQNNIKQIEKENENIDLQMQQLSEKKIQNRQNIDKLNSDIGNQTNALNSKKANFESTYNRFTAEIKENINKINTYIIE